MKRLLLLLVFLHSIRGGKILMYNPVFGLSHCRFMSSLADALRAEGHQVIELRPILDESLLQKIPPFANGTIEISVHPDVAAAVQENLKGTGIGERIWTMRDSSLAFIPMSILLKNTFADQCRHMLYNSSVVEDLRKEKFDVGIFEAFDFCGHGIAEAIGLKTTISTSTTVLCPQQNALFGIPLAPSYVPFESIGEQMNLVERAINAMSTVLYTVTFDWIADAATDVFRDKFGPQFPCIRELTSRSALLMTNSHPLIDFPHPTLHKVVDIGGISVQRSGKPNPLPKDWDDILNRKPKTVLISFGSVAQSCNMPFEAKQSILQTARNMTDTQFIWKYEKDDLGDLPENLFISKWTPQKELLADKRLSLFITHGGLGSTTEIAFSGTPAIVVPLFGDQPRNAVMLKRRGGAEHFDKLSLADASKLEAAIRKLLESPSYTEKAELLAEELSNAPFSPRDKFLRNTEFVMRFGSLPQLDPHGRQLSFVEYFLVDVLLAVFLGLLVVLFIVYILVARLFAVCKNVRLHVKRVKTE